MKVLQLLPSLEVGGVERGVVDLARAMKKIGVETVVISSGGELVGELRKMGVAHYTLPVHKKSLLSLKLVPKIVEIIHRERIDIIHGRSRVPAWLGWFAARQTGKPFVTTCHGYYSKHFLSFVMGWGKRVIAISRVIARHMIDDFGVLPSKIRLVHRGIDLSQFPFDPNHYDKKSPVFRIINVGRLSPIKGQLEFLQAVHLLRRKLHPVEVLLVGSEGKGKTKYTRQIQETIERLGLQSCVKLLGTRRDIPELIAQSDLLVLSTLVPEAVGRVIIEAGAVGRAVLATRVGGVLDIIEDGENGRLVPPGDINAMARSMYEMLTDRPKLKQLALKLRQKVESQFTVETMLDQTLAVYREAEREKKILLFKLGAMGDLILVVPSLRMIRQRFPQAFISLMVDKKLAPLVSSSPYVDEVIPVNRQKFSKIDYLLKLARKIRKEGYDLSVDFQNSKWTHLLPVLSGIPERYGYRRGKFGFLLNRPDRSAEIADTPVRHQFRLLAKLGIKNLDETLELWTDPNTEARMEEILGVPEGDPPKTIGFAIGASPQWASKRWPIDYFKELADLLIQKLNCRIVLLGSVEDAALVQDFGKENQDRIINLIGKTSLLDLISLVKRLDVLVTGDTAPLHVAAAMQRKIVALFGPTDPKRHMPPTNRALVFVHHLPCQPCYEGDCKIEDKLACMKKISVQEIFQAVRKHLTEKEFAGSKTLV